MNWFKVQVVASDSFASPAPCMSRETLPHGGLTQLSLRIRAHWDRWAYRAFAGSMLQMGEARCPLQEPGSWVMPTSLTAHKDRPTVEIIRNNKVTKK